MSDQPFDWRRQVLGHLESLRAAGVAWLPSAPPLAPGSFPAAAQTATAPLPSAPVAPVAVAAAPVSPALRTPALAALPVAAASLDQRRQSLQTLADEVKGCMKCSELCSTRTQTVFADGSPSAELCIIGEAPGADEDAEGLPFVGAAGQMLNRIIAACGMKREDVYICNILKCRPPRNRAPLPHEAANCRGFLERQLELVQPKFICAMGGSAAMNLLQTTTPIGKLRGSFHQWRGIPVMVTYHPAYLLPHRAPEKKKEVWEDMKMLLARMGRPVPART